MKDTQNAVIAVLAVSATILAAVLGLMMYTGSAALADTPAAGGDYIIVTGAYSDSMDLIYVIDNQAQLLNVYRYNDNSNSVSRVEQLNLKLAFR